LARIGREGLMGMVGVDKIGEIRRAYFEQKRSIKEIVRTLSVSRATVRKVIRGHQTEFKYARDVQPTPKLGVWVEALTEILEAESALPKRERRSTQRLFEELRGRGYGGAHDSVHRFTKSWREERARVPVHAYVPMSFAPGEAYQFDWSHETITLQGLPLTVKAAHMKLSHSRMPFVRVYFRETQELVFDAHDKAFQFYGGVCRRGIYDNLWTSPAQGDLLASAAGMHESIRPVAGRIAPLALMGVRCFWPRNMIGLAGLVVDQAWKLRSLPTCHQLSPRIQNGLRFSVRALQSCGGQIVLLTREHGPGDPCRLIGERDNRPVEAAPRRELLQPLGTAIVVFGQSKHDGAGAMNHLTSEIMIGAPADPAEPRFAAGRILTRHEANPCGEFPSRAKMTTVVNRSDERCCDHRTDAWQLREPPAGFVSPAKSHELSVELVESEIEGADFIE
jgi:transposase